MYYLGIDGGGTKTAFCIMNSETGIVSSYFSGPLFYMESGFESVTQTVLDGTHNCFMAAGVSAENIQSCFVGIPGFGEIDSDMDRLTSDISRSLKFENIYFGNDVEAGLAGSLACQPGINIVSGTGSIACGRDENGQYSRSGGWAHHFGGDEGSAYWIGCRLIQEFTRQSDGRSKKTRLYSSLKKHFSLKRDFDILDLILNRYRMERSRIASLSSLAAEIALCGDSAALMIFSQAAAELYDMISAVKNSLSFRNSPVSVSYSGGVFNSGDLILKPLEKLIENKNFRLVPPAFSPVTGACLLAYSRYHQGIDRKIINLLKEQNYELSRS